MAKKRCLLEMGMGTDLHGKDYTKAAQRAVRDALWHNSVSFPGIFESIFIFLLFCTLMISFFSFFALDSIFSCAAFITDKFASKNSYNWKSFTLEVFNSLLSVF